MAGGVYVLNFLLCICNNGPQSGPSSITSQPPYFTLSLLFPQTAVTSTDYQIPKNQTLVFHCLAFKCEDSSGAPWISCLQAFIGHFPLYPIFISLSLCLGWAQMLPLPRRVLTRYPWPKDLSLLWLLEQCFLFFLFRAAPTPYGSSQARGRSGATAADLHHSHSNTRSPTHWVRPQIKPTSSWILVRVISTMPQWELHRTIFSTSLWQCYLLSCIWTTEREAVVSLH